MTGYHDAAGAALAACPPLARKPPTVEMPPNQFEPAIRLCEGYEAVTGVTLDLHGLLQALGDERLALCPERRKEPR